MMEAAKASVSDETFDDFLQAQGMLAELEEVAMHDIIADLIKALNVELP